MLLSVIGAINNKAAFVHEIRFMAFHLIGRAFEQLVFVRSLKYKALWKQKDFDEEKEKLYKNEDEYFFREWKKNAVKTLNAAVPPAYKNSLGVNSWDNMMLIMDEYYNAAARRSREPTSDE